MTKVSDNAIQLEIKKYSLRQSKDGTIISFVLNPGDDTNAIVTAHVGTVFLAALVELSDSGGETRPVDVPNKPAEQAPRESEQKARRPFGTLKLSNQAGIKAHDKDFQEFCGAKSEEDAAEYIRRACAVKSRSDMDSPDFDPTYWFSLMARFEDYMTTQLYKDSIHAGAGGWK